MSYEYDEYYGQIDRDTTFWAMMCHLSSFAGILGAPIPFGNIIVPFIIWMIKKDDDGFIDFHGRECINFQISMLIYYVIAGLLCIILIGIPILIALPFINIFCTVKAAIRARDGDTYRYPFSIRFV